MDLQMQVRRGIFALAVWVVLGGIVLGHAGTSAAVAHEPAAAQSIPASIEDGRACRTQVRIELTPDVRLTVPCDSACKPLRNVAEMLHLAVTMQATHCSLWRTA